jgi:hypothetical protein
MHACINGGLHSPTQQLDTSPTTSATTTASPRCCADGPADGSDDNGVHVSKWWCRATADAAPLSRARARTRPGHMHRRGTDAARSRNTDTGSIQYNANINLGMNAATGGRWRFSIYDAGYCEGRSAPYICHTVARALLTAASAAGSWLELN